jgi:hypothetical protein
LEVSPPGFKSGLTPKVSNSESFNEQVLRKASIQAIYKEWYDFERDAILLRIPEKAQRPEPRTIESLVALAHKRKPSPWIIRSDSFQRGALVELEVELRAASTFRLSSMASEIIDIFRELPQSVGAVMDQIAPMESVVRLLQRFLVGLIPIESRATEFATFAHNDHQYIAHRAAIRALPECERPSVMDLYVVGVTEQGLYWKDIRRVLFSKFPVRVLARVGSVGVQAEWNEVKLLDLLGELDPFTVDKVRDGIRMVELGASSHASHESEAEILEAKRVSALEIYGRLLLERSVGRAEEAISAEVSEKAQSEAKNVDTQERMRDAFRQIENIVASGADVVLEAASGPDLRAKALHEAELSTEGQVGFSSAVSIEATKDTDQKRYLDSEIISISW